MHISFRNIDARDNARVAEIIRTVMPEFGAGGDGFAIHDPEVDHMHEAYSQAGSVYLVCEADGKIIGGAGVAPLTGGDPETCELRKMYFLPEGRGRGLGEKLLVRCLEAARSLGYRYCYVETFNTMQAAMKLYERANFLRIPNPLGNTGHFACDRYYLLDLWGPQIAAAGKD